MASDVATSSSSLLVKRFACDRCHAQKLRCPRPSASLSSEFPEPCLRCRKAQAPCILSFPDKVGRPPKATRKNAAAQSDANSSDAASHSHSHSPAPAPAQEQEQENPSPSHYARVDELTQGAGHDTPQSLLRSAAHSNVSSVNDNANEIEISYAFDDDSTAQSTTYDDSAYASRPALSLDPLSPMRPTRTPPWSMVEDILGQDMNLWPAQGPFSTLDGLESSMRGMDDFPEHAAMFGNMYEGVGIGIPGFGVACRQEQAAAAAAEAAAEHQAWSQHLSDPVELRAPENTPASAIQSTFGGHEHPAAQPATSILHILNDLNLKIHRVSEQLKVASRDCARFSATGEKNEVIGEVMKCSEELIDILSGLPGQSNQSRSPQEGFSSPHTDSHSSTMVGSTWEDQYSHSDNAPWSGYPSTAPSASYDGGTKIGHDPDRRAAPDSGVIFLVMGCYTQLVDISNFAMNCLCQHHRGIAESQNRTPGQHMLSVSFGSFSTSAGSSLETLLHLHTIMYLHDRLNKAMYKYTYPSQSSISTDPHHHVDHDILASLQGERPHASGNTASEKLASIAFFQVKEREHCLMKKARALKYLIEES